MASDVEICEGHASLGLRKWNADNMCKTVLALSVLGVAGWAIVYIPLRGLYWALQQGLSSEFRL